MKASGDDRSAAISVHEATTRPKLAGPTLDRVLATSLSGQGRRIVLVHGFTQTGRVWADVTAGLDGFEVVTVDLPGHGETPPDHDEADLWEAADLLGAVGGPALYLGYSLGARVALHLAIRHPGLVHGLVLVGAKGGYDETRMAEERQTIDEGLAARVEAVGTERFVDEWLQMPFNERLTPARAHREARLGSRPEGLASSLRYRGSGRQQPLWDVIDRISAPVLLVTGQHDMADVSADNARLARALRNGRHVVMAGVGHGAPFEAPDRFLALVREHLDWLTTDRNE